MQGKVEICGVNTSKLQTLSNAEMMRLIERSQQGDMDARSRLVEGNLKLVLSVVQRFLSRGENPDDLFQVGCIGLLKAIANFDTTKNVRFSTYGVPMIAGELRRYLRDYSPIRVSRSLRDTAYRVLQCRQQLTDQNGREPSIDEIAQALDLPPAQITAALDAITAPVSLYEPVYSEGGDALTVMDQVRDRKNTDEQWIESITLREAISHLSEREKRILALRFEAGRTQMEVAGQIGISQAQVSRLEKSAIRSIRNRRAEMNVPPSKKAQLILVTKRPETYEVGKHFITRMAYASELTVLTAAPADLTGMVTVATHDATVYMPMAELVDIAKELERIATERKKAEENLRRIEAKLANESFTSRAPENVVNAEREKAEKARALIAKLDASAAAMKL